MTRRARGGRGPRAGRECFGSSTDALPGLGRALGGILDRRGEGAEAEWGPIHPGACLPSPGDRITEIPTGVKDSYLAVVASSTPPWLGSDMGGITTSLYSFRKGDEDDRGTSWRVTCATSALPASTCLAALVFFAGGTSDVEVAIGAALGVPSTPVP